jgi:hypothetical protein
MSVFRQIVPNSEVRPSNERYEHLLMWLSPKGGVRQWLFSHTKGREDHKHKGFDIETITSIRSVPSEDKERVKVASRFMDSETFDYVRSIMQSNRVYKVANDGTKTPVAIGFASVRRPNMIKNFEIEFNFTYKENNVLNV